MSANIARNALAHETSPYLLQHADNPVAWYPWGEEALALARDQDKPILLSIGYSACHWCHVMAHESFEDEDTAALMNELFVNIKVDREERPDLDKIYQIAHQMLTQRGGGWPLTMFLTPADQMPFFGGTYFPRESRFGLPGFKDLLQRVAEAYRQRTRDIEQQNAALRDALERMQQLPGADAADRLDEGPLTAARREMAEAFDGQLGGFGGAPKFPHPTGLQRLLRDYAASGGADTEARDMVLFTLEKMAAGGIYDQVGGGFCRYSVDERWMIPHFEKMLYDNAPLLALYTEAWQITGDPGLRRTALETAEWALAEMRAPEGGFYSSLDADSEGEEGRFYAWTREEIEHLLTDEELEVAGPYWGLNRRANFEGKWHLYCTGSLEELGARTGRGREEVERLLARARARLAAARAERVRPGRDEKVLVSWNALMIKGLAVAGRVFAREEYLEAARRAVDFIHGEMWREGRLLATWKDGRAHLDAYLDDYAFLADALLACLAGAWRRPDLDFAVELAEALLAHFEDTGQGGFHFTAHDHEPLIQRPKGFTDDALPAGNGVAATALQRLGHLLGEPRYLEAAERTLRAGWASMERVPSAHNAMLTALEEYLHPPQTVVLRGQGPELDGWRARADARYAPRRVVLPVPHDADALPGLLAERTPRGPIVAYVCQGQHCEAPVADFAAYERALAGAEPCGPGFNPPSGGWPDKSGPTGAAG